MIDMEDFFFFSPAPPISVPLAQDILDKDSMGLGKNLVDLWERTQQYIHPGLKLVGGGQTG